jgi:DNA primase
VVLNLTVPRLSQEDIERTREATDIVELLSQYLPLKRAGKNFVALCPFHSEKKPSFNVSPDRQIYHCFGCGAGGNVYTFFMEMEKVTFPEAVKMLAKKAGIKLTEEDSAPGPRDALYGANEFASSFYHDNLVRKESGSRGREYLKKRGFGKGAVETFRLGYAPSSWDALKSAAKTVREDVLVKAGLLVVSEKGGTYDRFRDRLIFPIRSVSGRVIGFGGRSVGDGMPKYLNSPETEIYKKGSVLYGLWESKQEIRSAGRAVIVEGYTDLVSLWSFGVATAVASSGTALTEEQAKLLSRYAREVVIFFDADTAGDEAAVRGLDMLLEQGFEVFVVSLPKGQDPDSFVRKKGKESLEAILRNPPSFFDFKLSYLSGKYDMSKVGSKAAVVKEVAASIDRISDPVRRQLWVRELSQNFSISEDAIMRSMPRPRSGRGAKEASVLPPSPEQVEFRLLGLMLSDSQAFDCAREELSVDDFFGTASREVAQRIFGSKENGREVKPADVLSSVPDRESLDLVSAAMMVAGPGFDAVGECKGLVSRIKDNRIKRTMDQKLREIKEMETKGQSVTRLQREYQGLVELRRRECLEKANPGKEV